MSSKPILLETPWVSTTWGNSSPIFVLAAWIPSQKFTKRNTICKGVHGKKKCLPAVFVPTGQSSPWNFWAVENESFVGVSIGFNVLQLSC